jgi:hypothetical protein
MDIYRFFVYLSLICGFCYSLFISKFFGLDTLGEVILFVTTCEIILGLSSSRPNLRISAKITNPSINLLLSFLITEYALVIICNVLLGMIFSFSLISITNEQLYAIILLNLLRPLQSVSLGYIQSESSKVATILSNVEVPLRLVLTILVVHVSIGNDIAKTLISAYIFTRVLIVIVHLLIFYKLVDLINGDTSLVNLLEDYVQDAKILYFNNIMKTMGSHADKLILGTFIGSTQLGMYHLIKSFSTGIIAYYNYDRQNFIKFLKRSDDYQIIRSEIDEVNQKNIIPIILIAICTSIVVPIYFATFSEIDNLLLPILCTIIVCIYGVLLSRQFWVIPFLTFKHLGALTRFNVFLCTASLTFTFVGVSSMSLLIFCMLQVGFALSLQFYSWRLYNEVSEVL